MSKNRADIQFKVLAILTGGDIGQIPSAEDATVINGYIDDEVDELNADGTIYIADPDDLPNELFLTFCKIVANAAADEFGAQSNEQVAMQYPQPASRDSPSDAWIWSASHGIFLVAGLYENLMMPQQQPQSLWQGISQPLVPPQVGNDPLSQMLARATAAARSSRIHADD